MMVALLASVLLVGAACDGGIRSYRSYSNPYGFKSVFSMGRVAMAGGGGSAKLLALQQQMHNQQMTYQMMSNMMNMQHQTSMQIINNMGGAGTTYDHYQNGQYIGTWP